MSPATAPATTVTAFATAVTAATVAAAAAVTPPPTKEPQLSDIPNPTPAPTPVHTTNSFTRLLCAVHLANANLSRVAALLPHHALQTITQTLRILSSILPNPPSTSFSDVRIARHVLRHLTPAPSRSSPPPPPPPSTQSSRRRRLTVRITPFDDASARMVRRHGANPFIELALKPTRPVWDIVQHLFHKWGVPVTVALAGQPAPPRHRVAAFLPPDLSEDRPVLPATFVVTEPHIPPFVFAAARKAGLLLDAPPVPPPLPPAPSPNARASRTFAPPPRAIAALLTDKLEETSSAKLSPVIPQDITSDVQSHSEVSSAQSASLSFSPVISSYTAGSQCEPPVPPPLPDLYRQSRLQVSGRISKPLACKLKSTPKVLSSKQTTCGASSSSTAVLPQENCVLSLPPTSSTSPKEGSCVAILPGTSSTSPSMRNCTPTLPPTSSTHPPLGATTCESEGSTRYSAGAIRSPPKRWRSHLEFLDTAGVGTPAGTSPTSGSGDLMLDMVLPAKVETVDREMSKINAGESFNCFEFDRDIPEAFFNSSPPEDLGLEGQDPLASLGLTADGFAEAGVGHGVVNMGLSQGSSDPDTLKAVEEENLDLDDFFGATPVVGTVDESIDEDDEMRNGRRRGTHVLLASMGDGTTFGSNGDIHGAIDF